MLLNLWFSVWYFVDHCLLFRPFSFGHCIVCPSIYGFWLPPFFNYNIVRMEQLGEHMYILKFISPCFTAIVS